MKKTATILALIMLFIAIVTSGCLEGNSGVYDMNIPEYHTTNLKEKHSYEIVELQGTNILYMDNGQIRVLDIDTRDNDFYVMPTNRTYLYYEKYGGLVDFHQWILYIDTDINNKEMK